LKKDFGEKTLSLFSKREWAFLFLGINKRNQGSENMSIVDLDHADKWDVSQY